MVEIENNVALIEVVVVIAVSDGGLVRCSPVDDGNIQTGIAHKKWLQELKDHPRIWTLKTIRTKVPLPVQYEAIDV